MIDHLILNYVCSSSTCGLGYQGNVKLYYFQIRIRAFLFIFLQNQKYCNGKLSNEIFLNCLKMQQALLPEDMSNFNQKKY